jgi:MipA family protein
VQWALGAGVVGIVGPSYVGSSEQSAHVLPLPYLMYEGRALRADRQGLHFGQLGPLRLTISGSGSLPVDSDEVVQRLGMRDLPGTVELGPQLGIVLLSRSGYLVSLRAAGRGTVAASAGSLSGVGWVATYGLHIEISDIDGWELRFDAGPRYVSDGYAEFYYQVAPGEMQGVRAPYQARGGFAGWRYSAALTRRFDEMWASLFVRYDHIADAAFVESPLVQTHDALLVGAGLAWLFVQRRAGAD